MRREERHARIIVIILSVSDDKSQLLLKSTICYIDLFKNCSHANWACVIPVACAAIF